MLNKTFSAFFLLALGLTFGPLFGQDGVASDAESVCPLLPGQRVPDVMMDRVDGSSAGLHQILGGEPAVLIFYRGGW